MDHLMSENYRLRKYFLRTQEVPPQSMIRKKMSEPLAALYFNTMTPNLKVVAGLEPPMKGGGADWYVPPKSLLERKTVLKPFKRGHLSKLNYLGIDEICMKLDENRRKSKVLEKKKIISEHDEKWRKLVEEKCEQLFKDCSMKEANKNTEKIRKAFEEFSSLYASAITNIETVLFNAAACEINRIQNEALQKMQDKYETSVKQQATALYDTFTNRLEIEKLRLRGEFVDTLARYHHDLRNQIHDLNVEKHVSIEECRKFWECQRLACQVYVALKEKHECKKDTKLSDKKHMKKVKTLSDEISKQDYEIAGRGRKAKMQLEFEIIWQKKVSQIIKYFHLYVSYCLSLLPAHADFFINLEKLLLLQLDEVLENPSAENIFKEKECFKDPSPAPHPFYLFCDRSKKDELPLVKDLCPKRCTSSASHMPVIVVNKRCMYAACDNFQQFTNKAKQYIHGDRGDDMDFTDNHVYEYDMPVKYTTLQHLAELKLESSLLQILHQELNVLNTREPIVCSVCKVPFCFCKSQAAKPKHADTHEKAGTKHNVSNSTSAGNISKAICEVHRTEPRMETYFKSIVPKRCTCSKTARKHLEENLPIYMKRLSVFDVPNYLPSYETCSLATLKSMVRKVRGNITLPMESKDSKTRDVATQYNDERYDNLCNCFSDEMDIIHDLMKAQPAELSKYYRPTTSATDLDFLDSGSPTSVSDFSSTSSTALDRARERALERVQQKAQNLMASINAVPELGEIFKIIGSDGPATQRLALEKLCSKKSILIREKSVNQLKKDGEYLGYNFDA